MYNQDLPLTPSSSGNDHVHQNPPAHAPLPFQGARTPHADSDYLCSDLPLQQTGSNLPLQDVGSSGPNSARGNPASHPASFDNHRLESQPSTGCINPSSLKYKRQSSKQSLDHVRLVARSVSPTSSLPTTVHPTTVQASARANTGSNATLDEETRLKLVLELQKRYLQKTLGDRHVDAPMPYVPSTPSL